MSEVKQMFCMVDDVIMSLVRKTLALRLDREIFAAAAAAARRTPPIES